MSSTDDDEVETEDALIGDGAEAPLVDFTEENNNENKNE